MAAARRCQPRVYCAAVACSNSAAETSRIAASVCTAASERRAVASSESPPPAAKPSAVGTSAGNVSRAQHRRGRSGSQPEPQASAARYIGRGCAQVARRSHASRGLTPVTYLELTTSTDRPRAETCGSFPVVVCGQSCGRVKRRASDGVNAFISASTDRRFCTSWAERPRKRPSLVAARERCSADPWLESALIDQGRHFAALAREREQVAGHHGDRQPARD